MRDYVYVGDVAEAHALALFSLEGIYNVGTGEGHTTREVLMAVAEAAGKAPEVQPAPAPRGPGTERPLPLKLMAHGWRPKVGFQEGIRLTVDHFRGAV